MLPRLVRLPLSISSYSSDAADLTVTPPDKARLAAVAWSMDKAAALYDHEVLSISHFRREHVTKDGDVGVPLGATANLFDPSVLDGSAPRVQPIRPWPGLINNFIDYDLLRARYLAGERLTLHEEFRLANFGRLPCKDFAMIRLVPQHEFKISVKRIEGATSITRAYLWCIELDEADFSLFEKQEAADWVDSPHWLAHSLQLAAASGVEGAALERKFNAAVQARLGLQVWATFAAGYSNTDGTRDYDETYLQSLLVRWLGAEQQPLFPSYADHRQLLTEFTQQTLQEYDPCRRVGLWLPWQSRYYLDVQRLTTAQAKDVRLANYGLLKHSNAAGELVGGKAVCVC